MIVREAYRNVDHAVCRDHYHGTRPLPADAPVLGPVQDARDDVSCEFCEADALATEPEPVSDCREALMRARDLYVRADTVAEVTHLAGVQATKPYKQSKTYARRLAAASEALDKARKGAAKVFSDVVDPMDRFDLGKPEATAAVSGPATEPEPQD